MASSDEEREALELVRRANVALPGLYAWTTTVLYPASFRGVGIAARVAAGVALVALVSGVVVAQKRAALGRALALHVFVFACLFTWVTVGGLLAVDRLEPIKAALGAVGWVVFAFGWGASREPARVPEDDPRVLPGDPLSPRGQLPAYAILVLATSVVGASLPLLLAWRVTRPAHALFAHAVAVVAAVALVSSGAEIAVHRDRWAPIEPQSRRLTQAVVPLAGLALVLIIGVIELMTG
jgi:hypothetical protein